MAPTLMRGRTWKKRSRTSSPSQIWEASLRRLLPSQRAAVFLHYEANLPVREVARLMGTSAAAVRVHLMRGRRRLADLLGENDDDD